MGGGMTQGYVATIKLLVEAKSEAEACDLISETLSDQRGFVDWGYVMEGDTLTPLEPPDAGDGPWWHSPSPYLIDDDYEEGDFLHPKAQ